MSTHPQPDSPQPSSPDPILRDAPLGSNTRSVETPRAAAPLDGAAPDPLFDEPVPRRGTDSSKWNSDSRDDILPLWVADMDFRTAPAIIDALRERVQHGIFGYVSIPAAYDQALIDWYARRHNWNFPAEHILHTSGVVPAISAALRALTRPGDGVLVQTPVYNCFFSSIRNMGCRAIASPLRREGDHYLMDFEDLERRAADPRTTVMLLCNPHNPVGRVWTPDELRRISDICRRHRLALISDEIHGDLALPGYRYTPCASLPGNSSSCVTLLSASKAFNIAGLQLASIVCADPETRRRIDRAINIHEVCDVNPFGVAAAIAAYTRGEEWLKRLLAYIQGNYIELCRYFSLHLPQLPVTRLEGTYLVWVDCRSLLNTPAAAAAASAGAESSGPDGADSVPSLADRLLDATGLRLNGGELYGAEGYGYLRWNIACPRRTLRDAFERFRRFVDTL